MCSRCSSGSVVPSKVSSLGGFSRVLRIRVSKILRVNGVRPG
ncbi:hypothetical protein A2U01_0114728 [Trifolium medium]|uniref:Uncharacterized protein n=1 Tax=Trifolium medium TaxID=97028 RepID=A0A392W454_9FABA|nr:hypothetical protein [Trifolium medium]